MEWPVWCATSSTASAASYCGSIDLTEFQIGQREARPGNKARTQGPRGISSLGRRAHGRAVAGFGQPLSTMVVGLLTVSAKLAAACRRDGRFDRVRRADHECTIANPVSIGYRIVQSAIQDAALCTWHKLVNGRAPAIWRCRVRASPSHD